MTEPSPVREQLAAIYRNHQYGKLAPLVEHLIDGIERIHWLLALAEDTKRDGEWDQIVQIHIDNAKALSERLLKGKL